MDQLKSFMAALKKHHFWVLTGLVLILTLAGWYLASSDLAEQYVTNKAKIDGEFSELSGIVSKTDHPNETFEKGTNVLTADLRKDVQTAWSLVFADQKAKVLKWPQELGEDFVEWMDGASPDEEIPVEYRERYLNYVKEEFPRLLTLVDAKPHWNRDEEGAPAAGPGGRRTPRAVRPGGNRNRREEVPEKDFRVIWDRKNQLAIDETLDFPGGIPTSQAMRFCQENLWVYRALLNAVAAVNKDATGHHNAKIKEIIAVNIGQDASAVLMESLAKGRLVGADPNMASGMPMMPSGMGMGMEGGGMPEAPMGDAGGGEGMQQGMPGKPGAKPLDDKRYIDEKGLPMPKGTTGPAEFKRMPIVMRLVIDQREIAKLLVNLADSPLPVEIRQLRINTKMQGYSSSRPMMFGAAQESNARATLKMRRDKNMEEAYQNPYDLALELQGVIYIFNPPDKSLMVAEVTEEGAAALEAADPAEETPAAETISEPADKAVEDAEPAEKSAGSETDASDTAAEPTTAEPEAAEDEPAADGAVEENPAEPADPKDESAEEPTSEETREKAEQPPARKPPAAKAAEDDAPFGEE